MTSPVGILGVGLYLPDEIRRNDFWPPHVTAEWMKRRPRRSALSPDEPLTESGRKIVEARASQVADPFQGTVERRILPEGMTLLDMEENAARTALARAGIAASQVDLLLTNQTVPDVLLGNPACALHERLGLPATCLSMHTDVATHAFMLQLELATGMIQSGRARFAMLVQSCAPSRLLHVHDPNAPFFGDCATATLVGPVAPGRGIEATALFTDGRFPTTLIASVPGARWYDDGLVQLHVGDPVQMERVFVRTADACKQAIDAALAKAARDVRDVDFVCIHQGQPWLRQVVQDHAGLGHARSIDTFRETAYLFASTIPASLALAEERELLHAGDVLVFTGGGPGMTYGATVMTWGAQ
jgi:3-oxoacyl-[acyl-carrier-protein] synthase-3